MKTYSQFNKDIKEATARISKPSTTPHTPTDLYKKASKAGFSTGSVIADKVFRRAYTNLGDEEMARRAADAFLSGVARMELGKKHLEGIVKVFNDDLNEAKSDIASQRLETHVKHLVNNDWIIKTHTQELTKQIALYISSIKSLKEYLLLDPGIHTEPFIDHKQIKARIQIFEKALSAAQKYQATIK